MKTMKVCILLYTAMSKCFRFWNQSIFRVQEFIEILMDYSSELVAPVTSVSRKQISALTKVYWIIFLYSLCWVLGLLLYQTVIRYDLYICFHFSSLMRLHCMYQKHCSNLMKVILFIFIYFYCTSFGVISKYMKFFMSERLFSFVPFCI
jgi:hypothetical protein